jgi:hypothetical protein
MRRKAFRLPGEGATFWQAGSSSINQPVGDYGMRRYTRLAESDAPIPALKAEADPSGSVTLRLGKDGEGYLRLYQNEWRLPGAGRR